MSKKRRIRDIGKLDELTLPDNSTLTLDDAREWLVLISIDNVPSSKRVIWWMSISDKERITDTDIKHWQSMIDFAGTEWKGRL